MSPKLEIAILFGGVSSEHEVSRMSASSVLNYINKTKYNIRTIGITKAGAWYLTEANSEQIKDGSWENLKSNKKAVISPDREDHGILVAEPDGTVSKHHIDVVFPIMHGQNSEDGTIQGLFQISGISCVGSGTAASAAGMDKATTKAMVKQNGGVSQAKCYVSHKFEYEADKGIEEGLIDKYFYSKYPLFVKPANAGSSVGISKVKNRAQLEKALDIAFQIDTKVLVEEAIVGREIEVAVLGNDNPQASCIGEIFAANEFYDFNAKYENSVSRTGIVNDISEDLENEIKTKAIKVFNVIGCKGMARVDFFLCHDGRVVFNEINTLPGFTNISMYPKLWEASGIPYGDLIDRLIELAIENKPAM